MAAGRQAVQLDAAEIADFLASHIKVQVGTIGRDGGPHLTTLFYVVDDAGRIAFWTYGASQKIVNLRRDQRIACLVEEGDEYFDLRGVSISGRARLAEDFEGIKAIGTKVVTAMAGGVDLGDQGEAIVNAQARKRVGVIVEPVKVASWDHRKLAALPGQSSASGSGPQTERGERS